MKLPKFKNPYKLESELCETLIKYAKSHGWKVYPETSGWDILLVKDIQIGIQAKLKDNIKVLSQTVDYVNPKFKAKYPSPHIKAVLVPRASQDFKRVAFALGIFIIEGVNVEYLDFKFQWTKQIKTNFNNYSRDAHYFTEPAKLCWVPEIEPNMIAGTKSPKLITPWKIQAVKMCLLLNNKGFLTSEDFKKENMSMTIWQQNNWIINSKEKEGRLTKYVKNTNLDLPDTLYPEITESIKKSLVL